MFFANFSKPNAIFEDAKQQFSQRNGVFLYLFLILSDDLSFSVSIGGVGLEAAELRRESATACGASLEGERNSVSSSQLDQKNSWFARKKLVTWKTMLSSEN